MRQMLSVAAARRDDAGSCGFVHSALMEGWLVIRMNKQKSGRENTSAKSTSRRSVLRHGLGAGMLAAGGPYIVRDAFSSSGSVDILCWAGYLPPAFIQNFEKTTGIRVNYKTLGSNEELINKMKASKGRGYDVITPSVHRKGQWVDLDLIQPWDLTMIPNLKNVDPSFLKPSEEWRWGGGLHHLPHIWGTEGISFRTDLFRSSYGKLSFGDLWRPEMRGKVQGRPHSLMAGVGRYMAGIGKLPPFETAYENEAKMRRIWKEITTFAIAHKPWIKSFWNNHESQKFNFMQNECVIGQTWDGPAIELMKAGKPVQYLAPTEGAFAWLDGLSMPAGARNRAQAHEFVNAIYTVKAAAQMANSSGYNATVAGVGQLLDAKTRSAFKSAYPDDAISKLWWWPEEPAWYADIRSEYRDQFIAA